jgi:hypothetical protein
MSLISVDELRSLIAYDPATGDLRWRVSRGSTAANNRAGTVSHKGYRKFRIDGRNYYVHRVAWALHTGKWPDADIDHISGNTADNRITNLREATRSKNVSNQQPRRTNKSGAKGVSWHKNNGRWRAYIVVDGKQKSLGLYDDVRSAADAYDKAALAAYGEFAVLNRMIG